jgi:hypothetical protein
MPVVGTRKGVCSTDQSRLWPPSLRADRGSNATNRVPASIPPSSFVAFNECVIDSLRSESGLHCLVPLLHTNNRI